MPYKRLFDSHCHLNDPVFKKEMKDVLSRAKAEGVIGAIVPGYDLDSSKRAVELARLHKSLYAAVGIAPHSADEFGPDDLAIISQLAESPDVVALGETGLEYHHGPDKKRQQELFRAHIRLAEALELPLIIHSRDADDDLWSIIETEGLSRGVLHCFTGGSELMERAVGHGLFVSISGIVTFKNAVDVQRAAKDVPIENLLIETDAPYLSPIPHRGGRNEPSYLVHTLEKVAQLRGIAPDELAEKLRSNTNRLFFALYENENAD
jgi:TatD DNase family protein